MYYLLSLLAGMLTSVMVTFNGGLNQRAGLGLSLVIIHVTGLVFTLLMLLIKRQKPVWKKLPLSYFIGGLIGILTTLFNLRSFGYISVSAMMALGLLGESVASLLADHYGIMGLPKRPFRAEKILGGLILLIGIIIMMTQFELLAVVFSLLAGVTVLWSRLVNGRLGREIGVMSATLMNYITGLSGALAVLLVVGAPSGFTFSGPVTDYLGGPVGALIVIISSFVIGKIPSFYVTLVLFVGQVGAGLLLDMLIQGEFPVRIALGGLFVLAGLTINLMQDRAAGKKAAMAPDPVVDGEKSLAPEAQVPD